MSRNVCFWSGSRVIELKVNDAYRDNYEVLDYQVCTGLLPVVIISGHQARYAYSV